MDELWMDEYCSGFEGQGKDMGTVREIRATTAYIPFPLITLTDGQSGGSEGAEGQGDFFWTLLFLPPPSAPEFRATRAPPSLPLLPLLYTTTPIFWGSPRPERGVSEYIGRKGGGGRGGLVGGNDKNK